jgi:hopanoid biosynthesis associated RND transporter like protein HpnN
MLKKKIVAIVNGCTRHAWAVIVMAALLTVISTFYSIHNFSINTDVNRLISADLSWRKQELVVDRAFSHRNESILAVVESPTSELATQASVALAAKLTKQPELFPSVRNQAESEFFAHNGLLFLSMDEVTRTTGQLAQAQPIVQVLHGDPSWRGLMQALTFLLAGIQRNFFTLDDLARPLTLLTTPLERVMAGKPASFSWREMVARKSPEPSELRRIIEIKPVLDYTALEPGATATSAIRQAAADLKFGEDYLSRVRLTGAIPIQDEEFSTLKENADVNAVVSLALLLTILWLALRSPRIILAVFISIFVGLSITAALGLMMVGTLNPISVAFAVLFVGIGVDFGIQFSVRYRAERHEVDDLPGALKNAAAHVGVPLTLAAAATAAGFLSFLPTDYKGVSELGQVAGVGMIVAFLISITLLPALLRLLNPPGEPEELGYSALAPVDRFLERHRIAIIAVTALVSIGGLPLLYFLQFDFNPINLRSPKVESIATYLDLRRDPAAGANAIEVLAPSLMAGREVAERLRKLPEVERVIMLDSFIPEDQPQKLEAIGRAAKALDATWRIAVKAPPTDEEKITNLKRGADALTRAVGTQDGPGAIAAKRLVSVLTQLAEGGEAQRARAEAVMVAPLKVALDGVRNSLQAEHIATETMAPEIADSWIKPDGLTKIEVRPAGDPNDNETLRQFAQAVLAVEPTASGGPISILETGRTVIRAFLEAGGYALISIAILLWVVLRRLSDVLLTIIPLLLAGVVTLEVCVLIGLKLNFANIIALPLLLGVGVAFKIYYITAWRAGQTNLLQSSLTRAVIFSAMTTATAFGSLWLSSHPGMSSMGELLALSLVCTLAAAVLFQPVLMGPPREIRDA